MGEGHRPLRKTTWDVRTLWMSSFRRQFLAPLSKWNNRFWTHCLWKGSRRQWLQDGNLWRRSLKGRCFLKILMKLATDFRNWLFIRNFFLTDVYISDCVDRLKVKPSKYCNSKSEVRVLNTIRSLALSQIVAYVLELFPDFSFFLEPSLA